MKPLVSSSFLPAHNGGYLEARDESSERSLPTFDPPQNVFCSSDASSQVPNLRASEIFCAFWAAFKYPDAEVLTDIMVTGSVGQYSNYWGPWTPDDLRIREWLDFYSPHKRQLQLLSLAPISVIRFENGDIASQRHKALEKFAGIFDGVSDFNASDMLSRIKVVESLKECEDSGVSVGQVASRVPDGKAIGTWTCPCCTDRISLRHVEGKYTVTKSQGGPPSILCWGSQAVQSHVTDTMSLATLVRVTGIELNFFASVCLHDLFGTQLPTLMVRDYSNPRGNIAQALQLYGDRIRLTTRNYFVGPDGEADMTFDELCMITKRDPARFVSYMNLYPVISNGGCLMVNMS